MKAGYGTGDDDRGRESAVDGRQRAATGNLPPEEHDAAVCDRQGLAVGCGRSVDRRLGRRSPARTVVFLPIQ